MLILFDLDDTLVDHRSSARAGALALHRGLGLREPEEDFYARWLLALESRYEEYLSGRISFDEQRRCRVRDVVDDSLTDEEADQIFTICAEAQTEALELFEDVRPCLARLERFRLGIISNGSLVPQREKLMRCGVLDRFEHLIVSEERGCAKPARRIFLEACARFETDPHEAVYIGDRYDVDVAGARTAGLRGVWLDRLKSASSAHERPMVSTLNEFADLVIGWTAAGSTMPMQRRLRIPEAEDL